jgi:hypothetical protein
MRLHDIRDILDASSARRRDAGVDVWVLERHPVPWWQFTKSPPDVETTKVSLLRAVWKLPLPLFFVPETSIEEDLVPFIDGDAPPWRLNRSRTAEEFYRTEPASGLGNWRLYAAEAAVTAAIPNTFELPPARLAAFMAERNIELLIDCFHDDTDWCIALG